MSFTDLSTTQLVSLAAEQQVEKQQEELLKGMSTVVPTDIDLADDSKVAFASQSDEEDIDRKRKRGNAATSKKEKRLKEMSEEERQRFFKAERTYKAGEEARKEMRMLMQNPKLSEKERLFNRAERNLRKRQKKALISGPIEEELVQLFLEHNIDVSVKEVELKGGDKRSILHYNSSPVSPSMKSSASLKYLIVAMLEALHGTEIHTAWLKCGNDKNDKDVITAFKTLVKEKVGVTCQSVQTKETIFKTAAKNFLKLALELETLNRSKHFKAVTMIRELADEAKKEEVEGGKYQQRLASLDEADICLYTERHDFVFKEVNDNLSLLPLPFIKLVQDLFTANYDKIIAAATIEKKNTA